MDVCFSNVPQRKRLCRNVHKASSIALVYSRFYRSLRPILSPLIASLGNSVPNVLVFKKAFDIIFHFLIPLLLLLFEVDTRLRMDCIQSSGRKEANRSFR